MITLTHISNFENTSWIAFLMELQVDPAVSLYAQVELICRQCYAILKRGVDPKVKLLFIQMQQDRCFLLQQLR